MDIRKRLIRWAKDAWGLPLIYRVPASLFLVLFFIYGVMFFPSKEVNFSYATKETCVNHFTLFPGILRQSGDEHFKLRADGVVKLGGLQLASTRACIFPGRAPTEGVYKISLAPSGGWILKKDFAIKAGHLPTASAQTLSRPIPTSLPLAIKLSMTDRVFEYRLSVAKRMANCVPKEGSLECDIPNLGLTQGKPYVAELERFFQSTKVGTVIRQKIATLSATKVVKTTIKQGETVYSKPRSITLSFDKALKNVKPKLYRVVGKKKQEIKLQSTQRGKVLTIKLAADLPRSAVFSLTLSSLQATDGSSLEKPYTLGFKTSGGPKVVGINVGSTGVPLGSTFVVTFDQTLSGKQDITKLVGLSGGAVLAGKSGNQIFVSLAGVPLCGDFGIRLGNEIRSNYEIAGSSAWAFSGRMICHTTQAIGYSAGGRPIMAYTFGSGPAILYTGTIHGNEISTQSLMYYWIDELEANARAIPSGRSAVVIPAINPDGVAAGSRTNMHNVDLNRNFATSDWRKDITDINNHPFPGGGGNSPMSEPETQALAGFVQGLRPSLILSYHSIGGLVAANQAGISGAYAATYARLSGYSNTTGQSDTFEYSVSGTADDWYAQRLGIASILVELGSHTYSQFGLNQTAMWAMLR
jgi:predicted deacylase